MPAPKNPDDPGPDSQNPPLSADAEPRNRGVPLDLGQIQSIRINAAAVERSGSAAAATSRLPAEAEIATLLRALTLIDLTTLAGDDTPASVKRICETAKYPVPDKLRESLGPSSRSIRTAAVCVYHAMIPHALEALEGSGIPVAAVSAGFPAGLTPFAQRVAEIGASVEAGATEIDFVITRMHVLLGDWSALYEEVREFRRAAGDAHVKAILATGELGTLHNVARAAWVCMMGGADFIKTSTGKEAVNATFPAGLAMIRAIHEYHSLTGYRVGFKAAGGIRTAQGARAWMEMVNAELGGEWLSPTLFRFGASSLVSDVQRRLEQLSDGSSAGRSTETARVPERLDAEISERALFVVLADADLNSAAQAVAEFLLHRPASTTAQAFQICVQEGLADAFVERLKGRAGRNSIPDLEMAVSDLTTFRTPAEALEQVNGGWAAASLWTENLGSALYCADRIEAGIVAINRLPADDVEPRADQWIVLRANNLKKKILLPFAI